MDLAMSRVQAARLRLCDLLYLWLIFVRSRQDHRNEGFSRFSCRFALFGGSYLIEGCVKLFCENDSYKRVWCRIRGSIGSTWHKC